MDSVGQASAPPRDDTADQAQTVGGLVSEQVRDVLQTPGPRIAPRGRNAGARGGSVGPLAGPSRYNANKVSPSEETPRSEPESAVRQERRARRFEQRAILWTISTLDRVIKCGRTSNGAAGNGNAAVVMNVGVAHWSGLCSCGSIWACPVCAAKIRAVRADEIARAVAEHIRRGGAGWMVTLTARHKKHHELLPLFDAVANGWKRLMQGKAWVGDAKRNQVGERDALGVVGWIRSLEVTYGTRNGWHPHLHVVLLLDVQDDESAGALALARAVVRWDRTWRAWMAKKGFEPSREHGVNWTKVTTAEEAGEYIAKVQEGKGHLGNELARGDMKAGRLGTVAPFELLEYFRQTGDMAAVPVWHEYEKATFRRRAITWSRGLRAELLDDEPEKTDEEVANEEIGGETWAILPAESMATIRKIPGLQSRILDIAENGGFVELVQLFTAYHLIYEPGPDAPQAD